jgi:hypothetical protein
MIGLIKKDRVSNLNYDYETSEVKILTIGK